MAPELHELGKRIRALRRELGWSQERLAHEAKMDRSYMGMIERGEKNITLTKLCQISLALGCDIPTLTVDMPLARK